MMKSNILSVMDYKDNGADAYIIGKLDPRIETFGYSELPFY